MKLGFLAPVALAISLLGPAASAQDRSSPTVEKIVARGVLLCAGHNGSNLGFAEVDNKGQWKGFDVDICRAVATAILGSPDKAKFIPISWAQRWSSLDSGDVDLLVKTNDATMSRDTDLGFQLSIPYLYGAFQLMVHKDLNLTNAAGLKGGTICTSAGTNNASYLDTFLRDKKIDAKVLTFEKREEELGAYTSKRCDAEMNWGPTLAVMRSSQPNPDDNVILPDVITLAPEVIIVKENDDHFLDVVNWTFEALLVAEDNGVTQANVDQMRDNPPNPVVAKLLGKIPGMGKRLGLSSDGWAYNVVKSLGNYGEIYDRSLGKNSPYKLDRGVNSLFRNGGLFVPMIID
ncbi:MAG: transporter substrate-binding domain-containing protein [Acidisphaera sp.]|nr:transporter substrate-binding domain-containing protein [Acidisphaera sp.]